MALTRKSMKALGLTDEQIEFIIEAHTDTVSGLKSELAAAKETASEFETVKKELDDLKTANAGAEDYKGKYETLKTEYETYKSDVTARETKAAKEAAARAFFESKGIKGDKALKIAMRAAREEIGKIELDGGKIKDSSVLDDLVTGDFAGLVGSEQTKGADTQKPPINAGGNTFETMSLREKMAYANEHPNDEVVKAYLGK